MEALHRLARRGFVELRAGLRPVSGAVARGSLRLPGRGRRAQPLDGQTGIRLVLQRVAPSQANLERLAELIAANERDERCELMWGSPGTILAGRELGLDVSASVEWLRGQRDADGLWTQLLYGRQQPLHRPGARLCGLCARPRRPRTTSRRRSSHSPSRRTGSSTGFRTRGWSDSTSHRDGQIRMQWCHGAPGIVATLGDMLDEELAVAGAELTWRAGPLRKGAEPLSRNGRERVRVPDAVRAHRGRTLARPGRGRSRCTLLGQVGAQPVGGRARPLHALDGRPRHGPLSRRLHRRRRPAPPSVERRLLTSRPVVL